MDYKQKIKEQLADVYRRFDDIHNKGVEECPLHSEYPCVSLREYQCLNMLARNDRVLANILLDTLKDHEIENYKAEIKELEKRIEGNDWV